MAFSQNTESSYNSRSISLPSRPHPNMPQFEERLRRLKSSEAASTSVSSSSLIHRLSGLKELYDCLDELLLLQPNQQYYLDQQFDDQLDASLRLLDVCGSARDALLQMEESIQSIQSVLRRRGSCELNIGYEVDQYVSLRKKIKQTIKGSLKETKSVLERCSCDGSLSLVGILREMEGLTAKIFGSLLLYIASPKAQVKKSKWCVVSKLLNQNGAFDKDEALLTSEFDVAMPLFVSQNKKGCINVLEAEKLRSKMMNLEADIQELDEVLECMFRRLVKTRAILLNIFSA